jgi:Protein-disulfide isomerase
MDFRTFHVQYGTERIGAPMERTTALALAALALACIPAAARDAGPLPAPLEDVVLGAPDAPVLVEEYSSLTCASCASFHTEGFEEFSGRYVETGLVRYVLRPLPLDPLGAGAFMLARCGDGDDYYERVAHLFETQSGWASPDAPGQGLFEAMAPFGMDEAAYASCLADERTLSWILETQETAIGTLGIKTAPTFVIDGTPHEGAMDMQELSAAIDTLIARKER